MTDDKTPTHHKKQVEEMYKPDAKPPREVENPMQALMEEIRPKKWHHNYAWGTKKQMLSYNLPTVLISAILIYILNPFFPKTLFTITLAICSVVLFLCMFVLWMYIPPLKAAAFFYRSATFYFSGVPDCGLQQEIATFPYVVPEGTPTIDAIDMKQLREYLGALKMRFQDLMSEQRTRLKKQGVQLPAAHPATQQQSTVHTFFKTAPPRNATFWLRLIVTRLGFYIGLGCFAACAFTPFVFMTLLTPFLPFPLVYGIVIVLLAICVLLGVATIFPWRAFLHRNQLQGETT